MLEFLFVGVGTDPPFPILINPQYIVGARQNMVLMNDGLRHGVCLIEVSTGSVYLVYDDDRDALRRIMEATRGDRLHAIVEPVEASHD